MACARQLLRRIFPYDAVIPPSEPGTGPAQAVASRRPMWNTARARRDFLVVAVLVALYGALVATDTAATFLPFLYRLEGQRLIADELLLGLLLASTLGILWAWRRGREMHATLQELSAARELAEIGFENSPYAGMVLDIETLRFLAVNDAAVRLYGWSREEFLTTMSAIDLSAPEWRDAARARLGTVRLGRGSLATVEHRRKDGTTLWIDIAHEPITFHGRTASIGVAIDVTARELAEQQRRVAEARYRAVFENEGAGIVEVDEADRIVTANDAFAHLVGRSRAELEGLRVLDITHPDDMPGSQQLLGTLASGRSPQSSMLKRYLRPDGTVVWAMVAASRVSGAGTMPARKVAVAIDITSQRHAEAERERMHEQLTLAFDATGEGLWDWNLQTDDCFFSPALNRLLGFGPGVLANHIATWRTRVHPDDAARVEAALTAHFENRSSVYEAEHRLLHKNGSYVWVLDRGRVVQRDARGAPMRMVGTVTDVSERRDLEEQLRQAQKMEAVGQLAGGVAHDFNNLLTVIRTGLELALAENLSEETRADLSEVEMATERATNLTSQLLAFSRRRMTQPRLMSLNDAVDELAKLLSRVLTEDIDVRRRLQAHARVMADPGHVGQALLNIAVNARDAMPNGGTLTLNTFDTLVAAGAPETHDGVPPGNYSVISVGDSGTGMAPEVREHIFEPFFTTKPIGKGTGLGLASVYGIVKQFDGFVRLESSPGAGTKFFLYFPVAAEREVGSDDQASSEAAGGTEAVLVVEDDTAVRAVATRVLSAHGYEVRQAGNGATGLEMLASNPTTACVVADVVMPVMPGSAMAAAVQQRYPHVAVVLMSAHSHDVLSQHALPAGINVLTKPFSSQALLTAVREAIDAKRLNS